LQLPGPEESLKSLNIMLEHAQRLATFLNGDLLDTNQSPLTNQAISHYKEQVQLFGLRASRAATA
jgi:FtsZ-interacting cell division protein ZipA